MINSAEVLKRVRAYVALNGQNGEWDIVMLERVVFLAELAGHLPAYRPELWRSWPETCLGPLADEDAAALLGGKDA